MGHGVSLRLAVVACAGTLALAGCGRRGPLEQPDSPTPTPTAQAAAAQQAKQQQVLQESPEPGLIQSPNQVYEIPAAAKLNLERSKPARPINAPPVQKPSTFVLDPLL